MSGAYAVRALLTAHTPLTAVVPVARIHYGFIPVAAGAVPVLPALLVLEISGVQRNTVAMTETSMLQTDRVQVTAFAKTYDEVRRLMTLVRLACRNTRGTLGSVTVDSVIPEGRSADLPDPDTKTFSQAQDFMVRWYSTN